LNGTRTESTKRVQLGLRVDPELKRRLKSGAALEGISMEDKLHNILCLALKCEDLMIEAAS
jgi:plasmid stability protein